MELKIEEHDIKEIEDDDSEILVDNSTFFNCEDCGKCCHMSNEPMNDDCMIEHYCDYIYYKHKFYCDSFEEV